MEKYLEDFIDKIRLGEIISYENLAIIPVFAEGNGHYTTLKEAMDSKALTVKEISDTKHKSVGLGWDIRFEGKQKVGSALINEKNVIHMAFFTIDESEQTGNISGLSRRRSYRRSQGD